MLHNLMHYNHPDVEERQGSPGALNQSHLLHSAPGVKVCELGSVTFEDMAVTFTQEEGAAGPNSEYLETGGDAGKLWAPGRPGVSFPNPELIFQLENGQQLWTVIIDLS
ncbi:putative zinc finger protein 805-like [Sciurus carolinensis]|uniref:Zinc finger protein 805-like n=1 Tax=Sciurus carolinensis TaxID=30640 RepID=A0AA41T7K3_SCICA|nr:putative zinc finger protein 805-like [Sciurus carolinensis]